MATIEIIQIPCLSDNYGYLVHDPDSGETACIDTPETEPLLRELDARGWTLTYIWNTHHHYDHAGNNLEIQQSTGCQIIGPAGEADKIPGIDTAVDDGDSVFLGAHRATILNVGGHTLGHIAYHMDTQEAAFVGDALFALGCGRVFEGTMAQMWESLQCRFCGHHRPQQCGAASPRRRDCCFARRQSTDRADRDKFRARHQSVFARHKCSRASAFGHERGASRRCIQRNSRP